MGRDSVSYSPSARHTYGYMVHKGPPTMGARRGSFADPVVTFGPALG